MLISEAFNWIDVVENSGSDHSETSEIYPMLTNVSSYNKYLHIFIISFFLIGHVMLIF